MLLILSSKFESNSYSSLVLTSNYSFARDICQDAALYFNPLDPEDIAIKIKELISDKNLYSELEKKGKERLKQFGTARTRAEKYIKLCENIIKKEKNVQE